MRKIVAGLFMSLDGAVQAPDEWQLAYFEDEWMDGITAGIARADAVLLGRRTYLEFAELWTPLGSDSPMADFLNNTPKYVVSATLDTLTWANSSLITGSLPEALNRLKQLPGKEILIPGSPRLVESLLRQRLLDELSLYICPVVGVSGMRLFDGLVDRIPLQLTQSRIFGSGVLSVTYQPVNG